MSPLTPAWRDAPAAQQLLRECGQSTHVFQYNHGDTDERYTGTSPRDLKKLHRQFGEQLLAEADRTGDYTAFKAHCADSPSKAISGAIVAAQMGRAA